MKQTKTPHKLVGIAKEKPSKIPAKNTTTQPVVEKNIVVFKIVNL